MKFGVYYLPPGKRKRALAKVRLSRVEAGGGVRKYISLALQIIAIRTLRTPRLAGNRQ